MPTPQSQATSVRRPLGIWLLSGFSFVVAALFLLNRASWYLFPPQHAQLPPNAFGWVLLASSIAFIGGCYGIWAGSRTGRNIWLAALGLFTASLTYSTISGYLAFSADMAKHDVAFHLGWQEIWFNIQIPVVTFCWLILLAWYVRRPATRAFFESRSDRGQGQALYGMAITTFAVPALIFGSIEVIYQTTGAPRHPPALLAEQLRISPGSEMTPDELSNNFPFFRNGDANSWEYQESLKFTALLQNRFPIGSRETDLIAALKQQGFRSPPVEESCIIPGEKLPDGVTSYTSCSYDADPAKMLVYGWWRFDGWRRGQCVENVHVHWSDQQGMLTSVKGEYNKVCQFLLEPRHW